MGGPVSTSLTVIGDGAPALIGALEHLPNVRIAEFGEVDDDYADRWIARTQAPYVVHDHDPLRHVASAWVEFFDDLATLDTLDLEVDRVLAKLGSDSTSMPDYYVILDPESLAPTWKHWWLGVLPEAAPTRVIPWSNQSGSFVRMLRRLPTGRPWPEPRTWLRGVARAVPDRVGTGGTSAS